MSAEERLKALGIELGDGRSPMESYVPSVRTGNLVFISGLGPGTTDGREWKGKVGADLTLEEGAQSARAVGIAMLARIKAELGSFDRVGQIVKVLGFVASGPGFNEQPTVMNGFSDLMVDVFSESGRHARSAIGVSELPHNIPVEVEIVLEIK